MAPLRRPGMHLGFLPNPVDFSVEIGTAHTDPAPPFDLFYACRNPAHPLRIVCGRAWNMNEFIAAFDASYESALKS